MAHRTLSKPRRAPAGRGPGAEHRQEYRFAPAGEATPCESCYSDGLF